MQFNVGCGCLCPVSLFKYDTTNPPVLQWEVHTIGRQISSINSYFRIAVGNSLIGAGWFFATPNHRGETGDVVDFNGTRVFPFFHDAHIRNVHVDSSDNIFVTGEVDGDNDYIRKYNSAGVKQWESSGGGVDGLQGDGLDEDSNGNLYVGGDSLSSNTNYIAKYNSAGAKQWETTHDAAANVASGGLAVDSNDDIWCVHRFVAGDVVAIKFDTTGAVVLTLNKTHSGFTDIGAITDIAIDSANNILIVSQAELTKLNSSGVVQWQVTQASGSNYAGVAVNSSGDVVAIKQFVLADVTDAEMYDSSGSLVWDRKLNTGTSAFENDVVLLGVRFDANDNLYVGGYPIA